MIRFSGEGFPIFWNTFVGNRIVYIDGMFGAGKTLLSMALIAKLLADGYIKRAHANMPSVFTVPATLPLAHAAIDLDEAWDFAEEKGDVLSYAAFLRKVDLFLLLPSVWDVNPRLMRLQVYRIWNAYSVGVKAWRYEWRLNRRYQKDKGTFWLWNPHELFGMFPTKYIPKDDGGIGDTLEKQFASSGFVVRRKKTKDGQAGEVGAVSAVVDTLRTLAEDSESYLESGFLGGRPRQR